MVWLRTTLQVLLLVLGLHVTTQSLTSADLVLIPLIGNCSSSQFQCTNGGCIPLDDVCDCIKHCSDGIDEKNCTDMLGSGLKRHTYPLYCPDGKCISDYEVCNNWDDCGDGSDEKNCTGKAPCNHHHFECSNGKCIDLRYRCDGLNNCDDSSDEIDCTGKCSALECKNGNCVRDYAKCNCKDECGDGTDENNCADLVFHCPNGTCLLKSDVCNCENDCGDGADEENCDGQTFHCPNGTCLLNSKICNCKDDCGDGADEIGCEEKCSKKKEDDFRFVCHQNGKKLKKTGLNDGFDDCEDGSDENYCSSDSFLCADGECFQNSTVCQNSYGCANRSDGEHCIGKCSEFQCPGGGPCIHSNKVCDCNEDCGDGADEKNCKPGLSIKRTKISKYYYDDHYVYHCRNGQCFTEDGWDARTCVHGPWCKDYSDEMECFGKCDGLQCPNGRCISEWHQCDGIDDCGDGTDEKHCPDTGCKENQFQCASGECILKNSVCNNGGSPTCRDGSDGENCDWRADLRCGNGNMSPNYKPGQCNPFGKYPCCSDKGWCGNTDDHCSCPDCVDYRVCSNGTTYQTNNGATICTCVNGEYKCNEKLCHDGSAKILEDGCNYCICNQGKYEFCTERTCKSRELLSTDEISTENSTYPGELGGDE